MLIPSAYMPVNDTNLFHLDAITRSEKRRPLIIVFLAVGTGVVFASYLYSIDNLALLYYSDSVSHLVRARQLVDNSSPGLQQVGTVWLPLPHILLLPFSLVDLLFKTGLAGTFVSLPSIAIAAMVLYRIIKEQTDISWIAFVGACLYFLNPNILYLGITAMTEALFMLYFVISAYYFQRCSSSKLFSSSRQEHTIIKSKNHNACFDEANQTIGSKYKFIISNSMLKCSFFVALATLCRYEAWPIPVLLAIFTIFSLMRVRSIDKSPQASISNKRQLVVGILCTIVSFSGIVIWISYNWIYYSSPLEFLVSPYYSAASQALEGQNREFLFLQPLNAASTYGVTALVFFGPVILAGATFGYIIHRKIGSKVQVRNRDMIYLFLAIPSLFSFLTLVFGIGEMNYWWFNSRFLIMLSPLLILLLSILLKRINEAPLKNKSILGYVVIIAFLIYPVLIVPLSGGIVTLIDAKNSVSYGTRPYAMEISKVLGGLYDGGKILMITGSAQQNIIMQASGIPLTNFHTAIEELNLHNQIPHFEVDSRYVILSKKPDPSSQNYAKSWAERQDELRKYFDKSYENTSYLLLVRNGFSN
ncbi:MAG: hypothetical protein ACR2IS_18515 [Nitrososphaeraceae archaeon]